MLANPGVHLAVGEVCRIDLSALVDVDFDAVRIEKILRLLRSKEMFVLSAREQFLVQPHGMGPVA